MQSGHIKPAACGESSMDWKKIIDGIGKSDVLVLFEYENISEEGIQKTQNDLIYVARPMEFDSENLFEKISYMREIMEGASSRQIVDVVKDLVPTFKPQNEAYKDEEKEEVNV